MPSTYHLILEPAAGGRFEHRLGIGSFTLGREEASCDIPVLSPEVSRQHVRLTFSESHCEVEDLDSTAGTFHAGERLTAKRSFACPFELRLGTASLQVSIVGESIGSTLPGNADTAGHYTKGKEIARGGMGAILEANDQLLGRTVAMKVVLQDRMSEDARLRFVREATVLGQLEHPNIVPIHEMGRDADGNLFYTMKKVEGRTLQAIINDLKKGDSKTIEEYPLERLLTIFRKVCDAIGFAHSKGIIHRDLKPENIMVGAFGEVLVMDWGLAKVLTDAAQTAAEARQVGEISTESQAALEESALPSGIEELSDSQLAGASQALTMDGAVMGSPQYMSPEQAEGRIGDINERSDIFSLGGVLYSILTLRPPVEGRTARQALENIKSGNINPPTYYNPGSSGTRAKLPEGEVKDPKREIALPHCPDGRVPAAVSAVTMKALAHDPAARYLSVPKLSAEIDSFQLGHATTAEEISFVGEFLLLVKRNRGIAIATAVGLVSLVAVTAGFLLKVNAEKVRALAQEKLATEAKDEAQIALELQLKAEGERIIMLAKAQIALAEVAFRNNDLDGMIRALEDCPERFRDSTWNYLSGKVDQSLGRVELPFIKKILSARAIPDQRGRFLLSGTGPELFLVDMEKDQLLQTIDTGQDGNKSVSLSGDGTFFAVTAKGGKSVDVYRLPEGERIKTHRFKEEVHFAAISHDGRRLAVMHAEARNGFVLTDSTSGEVLWSRAPIRSQLGDLIMHPDGTILFCARSARRLMAFSGESGKILFTKKIQASSVALNRTGNRLAVGAEGGRVYIVDPHTGEQSGVGKLHDGTIRSLVWSNEDLLFSVGKRTDAVEGGLEIGVWNEKDLTRRGSFFGLMDRDHSTLAYDPLSGIGISYGRVSQKWRIPVGLEAARIPLVRADASVSSAFLDDRTVLVDQEWTLCRFDVVDPRNPVKAASPISRGYNKIVVQWETGTTAIGPAHRLRNHGIKFFKSEKSMLAEMWSAEIVGELTTLSIDRLGKRVLACDQRNVFVIDTASGERLASKSGKLVDGAFVGPNDSQVAGIVFNNRKGNGAEDLLVRLDAGSLEELSSRTHRVILHAMAVSPDGKNVALGGVEQTVEILDAVTFQQLLKFRAHDTDVTALAYHPNEEIVVSGAGNGRVKFWNARTGALIKEFWALGGAVMSVSFSPSGGLMMVTGKDLSMRLFQINDL